MKAQMKIAVQGEHNQKKFDELVGHIEQLGWKVDRLYGGAMPNYKGYSAELSIKF